MKIVLVSQVIFMVCSCIIVKKVIHLLNILLQNIMDMKGGVWAESLLFKDLSLYMQAIMETTFDAIYLITVVTLGIIMICKGKQNKQYLLFGIMAVTLGAGDAFHLVPRAYALCTTGLENFTVQLGTGKFITSLTMTVFYILLYYVWRLRYEVKGKNCRGITIAVYAMAVLRIALCLFPQNEWTSSDAPLSWGIYRNLPFAVMGIIVIVLFYMSAKKHNDKAFKLMWLTIVLSFAFYIPVVLLADKYPLVGMLMIPKTCAYVWTVLIGFQDMRKTNSH